MSWVLSCKTKDKGLKQKLERYARANGLSKSKAIEGLLNKTLQNRDKNEFTAGILKEKKAVNSLLCLLTETEAKTKQLRLMLKEKRKNDLKSKKKSTNYPLCRLNHSFKSGVR